MNERINGLWWKARIGYNNQSCDPEVLEKFAELIVRECLELTLGRDRRQLLDRGDLNGANLVQKDIIRVIHHFGVEE